MEHFSLSLLGYNRQQVNKQLESYHERINELEKSLESLKKEHETIMDEVIEYRDMEAALQKGIVDAHMTGNKIIDDSTEKADRIIQQTNAQIMQYKEDFAHHSRELAGTGTHLKDEMKAMKNAFQEIIDTYQEKLDQTDFDSLYPKKHIERLLMQVESYEANEDVLMDIDLSSETPVKSPSISEDERQELEKLIQEVISYEEDTPSETESSSNLVDFSMIKNSKEG